MTRSLQKLVHVGCKQLGLDSDARHSLQLAVTGKDSLRDMNQAELLKVIDRLKTDGFDPNGGRKKRPAAPRADLRLIHVLWRKLAEAGEVHEPGRAGLNAFVRKRFGDSWGSVPADIDMLRDWQQIDAVLQALKAWCRRAGISLDKETSR